ncbi:hypothetical protein M3Y97_00749900 [Aphelenchoides bicaudatus]|nr:hypothetical protein M3Y97_00749900 [Aphelenchoides bicaudatus]
MFELRKPNPAIFGLFLGSLVALALTIFGISYSKLSFFIHGEHDTLLLSLQVAEIVLCVLSVVGFAYFAFVKGFPEEKPDKYVIALYVFLCLLLLVGLGCSLFNLIQRKAAFWFGIHLFIVSLVLIFHIVWWRRSKFFASSPQPNI